MNLVYTQHIRLHHREQFRNGPPPDLPRRWADAHTTILTQKVGKLSSFNCALKNFVHLSRAFFSESKAYRLQKHVESFWLQIGDGTCAKVVAAVLGYKKSENAVKSWAIFQSCSIFTARA